MGEGRYVIVLKDSIRRPGVVAHDQAKEVDGEVGLVYRASIKGYSAILPKAEVETLKDDPRIAYVVPDRKVTAFSQVVPTGLSRTYADSHAPLDIDENDDVRIDVDVAVLDTGVDHEHPDLNVFSRVTCIPPGGLTVEEKEVFKECVPGGKDGHGHGTHVAGTIGALDNGFGVVGIAPGARIWAAKVLSDEGTGYMSSIIAGVEWVTEHAGEIEIANMSLGCECPLVPLDEAITASTEAGVVFVVAAGNNAADSKNFSPASNPDVITVSALADYDGHPGGVADPTCSQRGEDDHLASFSNFGSPVDIAAPGVCIYSTFPTTDSILALAGTDYGYLSGTSMASPHVAGAAAILASESNPNSLEDVEAIRQELVEGGNSSWTDTSGDGIFEPFLEVGTPTNEPVGSTRAATSVTKTAAVLNGILNPNGVSAEYWFEYGKTSSYSNSSTHEAAGSGTAKIMAAEPITGLEPSTKYHYRIVVESTAGKFTGLDRTFSTAPKIHFDNFGTTGEKAGQLDSPSFTAVDEVSGSATMEFLSFGGNIKSYWVSDYENDRISRFTAGGMFMESCGEGLLDGPTGIEVNPYSEGSGEIFVSDSNNDRVAVFSVSYDWECKYVGSVGEDGKGEIHAEFDEPMGLAFAPEPRQAEGHGALMVAEKGNDRIQYIDWMNWHYAESTFNPTMYGSFGSGEEELDNPTDITLVDEVVEEDEVKATYAITDSGNDRVQLVQSDESDFTLSYVDDFGETGEGAGDFSTPMSVALDRSTGLVDVTDTGNDRVQEFLPDGTYVDGYGAGSGGKLEEFDQPTGIAIMRDGRAFIADRGNDRISVWGPNQPGPRASALAVSYLTATSADLSASIDPNGANTTYYFEYYKWRRGHQDGATVKTPEDTVEAGAPAEVSAELESLDPNTLYHFRLIVSNGTDERVSEESNFHTKFLPPVVTTEGAAAIRSGTALLQSTLDPKNAWCKSWFEFGATSSYGSKSPASGPTVYEELLGIYTPGNRNQEVSGFTPETTFHYRIAAENSNGEVSYGADKTFTTSKPKPPVVITSAWPSATKATTATFAGSLNSEGSATTYQFEYGTTTAYGSKLPVSVKEVAAGTPEFELKEGVTGLTPDTTYHYRLKATNSAGTSYGADLTFKTGKLPKAVTDAASGVTAVGAMLKGTVTAEKSTWYQFEYGTSVSYGMKAPASQSYLGTSGAFPVEEAITGLSANTTYHFRVVGIGSGGTVYGEDQTFTTLKAPKVGTQFLDDVESTKATLKGYVNPEGTATAYQFEYGKTTSYGSKAPSSPKSIGAGVENIPVTQAIEGLEPNTTYHYRIVAEGGGQKVVGTDLTFRARKTPLPGSPTFSFFKGSAGQYVAPDDIAVDSSGHIWVADYANNGRIQELDEDGDYLSEFDPGGFPTGIAIDSEDGIWVSVDGPYGIRSVAKYDSEGTLLAEPTWPELHGPEGLAVDDEDRVYIADAGAGNSRVVVFDSEGEYVSSIGSSGGEEGQFTTLLDVDIDPAGHLWVADSFCRFMQFTLGGEYLSQVAGPYCGAGKPFESIAGMAIDAEGNIWATDPVAERVVAFDPEGELLTEFETHGKWPWGIALDGEGGIWIGNQFGTIEKWVE